MFPNKWIQEANIIFVSILSMYNAEGYKIRVPPKLMSAKSLPQNRELSFQGAPDLQPGANHHVSLQNISGD